MTPLMLPEEFDVGAHKAAAVAVERVMGLPMQLHALLAPKEQGAAPEGTGHRKRSVGQPQVLVELLAIFSGEHTARLWAGEGVGGAPVHLEVALQGLGLGKLLSTHRAWQGAIWWALALQRAGESEVAGGQLYRAGWGREGGVVGFWTIQVHHIYCALYFYYYYIVIYNEIITQLTIIRSGIRLFS